MFSHAMVGLARMLILFAVIMVVGSVLTWMF